MNVQVVPKLNDFQLLVVMLTRHFQARGVEVDEVTPGEVAATVSRMPPARRLLERMGMRWHWPEEEQVRLSNVVKYNMSFWEKRIYVFSDMMQIEAERECEHHTPFFCVDCENEESEADAKAPDANE